MFKIFHYILGREIMIQKKLAKDIHRLASRHFFRSPNKGGDVIWRNRSYDNRGSSTLAEMRFQRIDLIERILKDYLSVIIKKKTCLSVQSIFYLILIGSDFSTLKVCSNAISHPPSPSTPQTLHHHPGLCHYAIVLLLR